MELSDTGLLKWLQWRVIPKNRAYVAEILKTFGLSINDTKGIIDVCKGLSLNDSFWVVPQGFAGTFAQYNLYEKNFQRKVNEDFALWLFFVKRSRYEWSDRSPASA